MKKLVITSIFLFAFLFAGKNLLAQTSDRIQSSPYSPTAHPDDTLIIWAKEAQPHFAEIVRKLNSIKPQLENEIKIKKSILEAYKKIKLIIARGKRLKESDARTYDTWFRNIISQWIGECLENNPGSECCFSCQGSGGSGWGASWCAANCFLFRFPGL